MDWKALLQFECDGEYKTVISLIELADNDKMDWKPSSENNWMTQGQLLKHLSDGISPGIKGFLTGDWGIPEGVDLKPEEMLPPAEKMPGVDSIADAISALQKDQQATNKYLDEISNEDLNNKTASAPWDPRELTLGHRFLQMVEHVKLHKAQLFYYLKLQGKPVHTDNLWSL